MYIIIIVSVRSVFVDVIYFRANTDENLNLDGSVLIKISSTSHRERNYITAVYYLPPLRRISENMHSVHVCRIEIADSLDTHFYHLHIIPT